jgi:hypothetical protein
MSGSVSKRRRIKQFSVVEDYKSLDELIAALEAIRRSLPDNHEAELRLKGDDFFGRTLTISWFRDQTEEEASVEDKYRK